MKLSKTELQKLIKEEVENFLDEGDYMRPRPDPVSDLDVGAKEIIVDVLQDKMMDSLKIFLKRYFRQDPYASDKIHSAVLELEEQLVDSMSGWKFSWLPDQEY